jgi:hypothetical protein
MNKTERPTWEMTDWLDLQPEPGSFVSAQWNDYEVHGETIHAANWMHAEYLWLKRQVDQSGGTWQRCCHCNQSIRYAVVFRDETGRHHIVGQDCASFISSKLDRDLWDRKRRLSEVKEVQTRHGLRFALTIECPPWFWDIPKPDRPKFTSVFRGTPGHPSRWYLTVWGNDRSEVIRNFGLLIKREIDTAPQADFPEEPPRNRRMSDTRSGDDVRIEFPSRGATYCRQEYGVYKYDVYPRGSVLAGQERRTFVNSFPTLEAAQAKFPHASTAGCGFRKPYVGHLPAEGDPDDIDF